MNKVKKLTPVAAAAAGINITATKPSGRGVSDLRETNKNNECACSREKRIVLCQACGYYCRGRIRLKCSLHPRDGFLYDISTCVRCHSSQFLSEHSEI